MRPLAAALALTALTPLAAAANDSMAELRAGGLVYLPSEHVSLSSEDLYLSEAEVRVDYVFHNDGTSDETSLIAFPMPDIEGSGDFMVTIPHAGVDNFMDFSVTIDGQPVEPKLQQHVFAAEVDVTDELRAAGIPLHPYGEDTSKALAAQPKATLADWVSRGLIINMPYDNGAGMQDDYVPIWRLKTTYYWTASYPAGKDLHVAHRYKPGVGTSAGLLFVNYDPKNRFSGDNFEEQKAKYCFDQTFLKAVAKRLDSQGENGPYTFQSWMSYILTTGANWGGTIGRFHLTVDKGSPDNLVSFCGEGVKKTGPTTFELTATDFYPERDIDIAIVKTSSP